MQLGDRDWVPGMPRQGPTGGVTVGTFVIGITGASGAPYARTVLHELLQGGHKVYVVISDSGRKVLQVESGVSLTGNTQADVDPVHEWLGLSTSETGLKLLHHQDVAAPIASGSYPIDGMAIVPCSGGVLGRIANGISNGLIERAADVCLKERRRLILVPRETPVSLVHLRNMTAVTEAGAIVLPASPGFYHSPETIQDLVDAVAGRIIHHLGVDTPLLKEWRGPQTGEHTHIER